MISALILASALAPPPRMPRPEALERRLAHVQAEIDGTMDLDTVTRMNAEYARLQRELDRQDMARLKANTRKMERLMK